MFFNKGWLDFTGRSAGPRTRQWLGRGCAPDDLDRCLEVLRNAFDARQNLQIEYRVRRFDGEYLLDLRSRGCRAITPDGKFLGVHRLSQLTLPSANEAELEVVQQRAELAHIARVSTMGELAASLAHELNQPLTAILSNAQAAQRFLAAESGGSRRGARDSRGYCSG